MYDRAANITSNKVRTSIVFIGHHPPLYTRGHQIIGNSHPTFFSITQYHYTILRTYVQRLMSLFPLLHHPNNLTTQPFPIVTTICTVDFEIPNFRAACLTVAPSSMMYSPISSARSSM